MDTDKRKQNTLSGSSTGTYSFGSVTHNDKSNISRTYQQNAVKVFTKRRIPTDHKQQVIRYNRETLLKLRNAELSLQWPKALDRSHIGSSGLWDPVKPYDRHRRGRSMPLDSSSSKAVSAESSVIQSRGTRRRKRNTKDGVAASDNQTGSRNVSDSNVTDTQQRPQQQQQQQQPRQLSNGPRKPGRRRRTTESPAPNWHDHNQADEELPAWFNEDPLDQPEMLELTGLPDDLMHDDGARDETGDTANASRIADWMEPGASAAAVDDNDCKAELERMILQDLKLAPNSQKQYQPTRSVRSSGMPEFKSYNAAAMNSTIANSNQQSSGIGGAMHVKPAAVNITQSQLNAQHQLLQQLLSSQQRYPVPTSQQQQQQLRAWLLAKLQMQHLLQTSAREQKLQQQQSPSLMMQQPLMPPLASLGAAGLNNNSLLANRLLGQNLAAAPPSSLAESLLQRSLANETLQMRAAAAAAAASVGSSVMHSSKSTITTSSASGAGLPKPAMPIVPPMLADAGLRAQLNAISYRLLSSRNRAL